MSNELRETINICIECFLFAILILIVSFFGGVARDSLDLKVQQNNAMVELGEIRNLYEYTSGKQIEHDVLKGITGGLNFSSYTFSFFENNILDDHSDCVVKMKGDDVIKFVGTFPREYDIYIYDLKGTVLELYSSKDANGSLVSSELRGLRGKDDFTDWQPSKLSEWLGSSVTESKGFYCLPIYNSDLYEYEAIIFMRDID